MSILVPVDIGIIVNLGELNVFMDGNMVILIGEVTPNISVEDMDMDPQDIVAGEVIPEGMVLNTIK